MKSTLNATHEASRLHAAAAELASVPEMHWMSSPPWSVLLNSVNPLSVGHPAQVHVASVVRGEQWLVQAGTMTNDGMGQVIGAAAEVVVPPPRM